MIVERFKPEHLELMRVQAAQRQDVVFLSAMLREAFGIFPAFTGFVGEEPIACAGILPGLFGMGEMWAFLSERAGPHMLALTRAGERLIALYPFRRLETDVPVNFSPGCRWLELLGFEWEGPMRKYGLDGSDHYRYARVA